MMTGMWYRGHSLGVTSNSAKKMANATTHADLEWEVRGVGIFPSWNSAIAAVDAIAKEPKPDCITCSHCGIIEILNWGKLNDKLVQRQACFTCNHFLDLLDLPGPRIIVDGGHYMDGGRSSDRRDCLGFSGREWNIEFFDGTKMSTNNLWHQGTVPNCLRRLFPDNAKFV